VYLSRFSAWAPGLETAQEWMEWAYGKREIRASRESPEIGFTDPLFRRRLSQISKMTIRVIHDIQPIAEDTQIMFISFRGELIQQYKINKMLIEDGELLPAAFSLSVFNTPPALASIALNLSASYSALYPAEDSFESGIAAAAAPVLCGRVEKILFVYADEMPPPEYTGICPGHPAPLAFSVLISREPEAGSVPLKSGALSPAAFLRSLILALGKEKP
jgi:hypothetical protein